jgi:glycosyltransferase involved in cell wall biosynthesis
MTGASVSAIICTRNRAGGLAKALAAMSSLGRDGHPFELIVVDNGSKDETKTTVSLYQETAPFPVIYKFEPRVGLSNARNCGLRHASGDVLAFTDDDCYVHQDWLTSLASVFSGGPPRLIGGRVELYNKNHLPITIKTDTKRQVLLDPLFMFGFIHGANLAFSRAVYNEVGEFDPRLGAGTPLKAAEDTDYIYRAFHSQFPVSYEPSVAVDHDHGRSTAMEADALARGYIKGIGAIAAKHLLNGKTDLLKAAYWNVRGDLAHNKTGTFDVVKSKLPMLTGALRYAVWY